MNYKELDKFHVWHPFTQMQTAPESLLITRASGASLYTEDEQAYIDVNSSWWVNVHGHANAYIGSAISEQFKQLDHVIFAGVTHPKAIELAARLSSLLPAKMDKVFFSDDGSTAVEVALKMAFQYWSNKGEDKKRILAMHGAYHGDTFGAMSVGQRGYFNRPFEHFFFTVDFIDFPTPDLEKEILIQAETYFKSNDFAAIILEPLVQGSAGMRMYSIDFLNELVSLARRFGVLVILDEVMTGWGRTGRYFAWNHTTIEPDIICLSKGLTGGVLPLGLTVATQSIYNAFLSEDKLKALLHGHSFTGNALSCAAACASLDLFERTETWDAIRRIELQHSVFAQELETCPLVEKVRCLGTILAFDIKEEEEANYFSGIRDYIYDFYLVNGVLLRPLGNVVFFNPPYCISNKELEKVYAVTRSLLEDLIAKQKR